MTIICMSQWMFFVSVLGGIVVGVAIGWLAFAPLRGD